MPKLPDNDLPAIDSLWLNHGAVKRDYDTVPTVRVTEREDRSRGPIVDFLIRYVNVATGRRGSTTYRDRFRLQSAFSPAPVPVVVEARPIELAPGDTLPGMSSTLTFGDGAEVAPDLVPTAADFAALLELQRQGSATLAAIADTLTKLVEHLVVGRLAPYTSPAQMALPLNGKAALTNGAPVASAGPAEANA